MDSSSLWIGQAFEATWHCVPCSKRPVAFIAVMNIRLASGSCLCPTRKTHALVHIWMGCRQLRVETVTYQPTCPFVAVLPIPPAFGSSFPRSLAAGPRRHSNVPIHSASHHNAGDLQDCPTAPPTCSPNSVITVSSISIQIRRVSSPHGRSGCDPRRCSRPDDRRVGLKCATPNLQQEAAVSFFNVRKILHPVIAPHPG